MSFKVPRLVSAPYPGSWSNLALMYIPIPVGELGSPGLNITNCIPVYFVQNSQALITYFS